MTIDMLKAKIAAMPKLFPDKKGTLAITDNLPVTFFVLLDPDRDFSTKGMWYHPVGVHWQDGKQIVCRELEQAGPCSVCQRIGEMERQGVPETTIFKLRAPMKIAMNILVRGEEVPKVFLAPMTAGRRIIDLWETVLNEDVINIFDPLASHAFTVIRSKQNGRTQWDVDPDLTPAPIVTGPDAEKRIARILKSAANLDVRFQLPAQG
jgi:hypothetical protein